MASSLFDILSFLRPTDANLSDQEAWLVQVYRLLSLLAALLIPIFGALYQIWNPAYVDPWSARVAMSSLFGGTVALSYISEWARRHYKYLLWTFLYVLFAWITVLAALNQINGDYAVAVFFVFCVVGVSIGIGLREMRPLVWFLGYGLLVPAGAYVIVPSPETSPFALVGCIATLGLVLYVIFRARLTMRRQLRVAQEEAQAASQLKSALLANMSHEVRTPLTSILGFAEVISDADPNNPAPLADRIRQSGRRLLDTLDSVLRVSRLESGAVDLEPEPLDVGTLVTEQVEALSTRAERQDLHLTVHRTAPSLNARVDADATKQVVNELVRNAIAFSEAGDRIHVTVGAQPEHVTIAVEDTGIGMPEERLDELVRPFEQASVGWNRTHEGAGLGLTVAHRLVQLMDGSMEVSSEEGEGTRVIVTLPRYTPDPPRPENETPFGLRKNCQPANHSTTLTSK